MSSLISLASRSARLGVVMRQAPGWDLEGLNGRISELSSLQSSVAVTVAMGIVLNAQIAGETSAWITTTQSSFFPPDAAALGVSLQALVVIRAEHTKSLGRAADHLARSGGFGLLVLDLSSERPSNLQPSILAMPLQSRLLGLAQKHRMALVVLSKKSSEQPSLSSLVSLRGQVVRRALSQGRFVYETLAIKDKQRAPGWSHAQEVQGPPGLR